MDKKEKLLNSVQKLQNDLDSLKQKIEPELTNNNDNFKIVVRSVDKNSVNSEGAARLDGDIETI